MSLKVAVVTFAAPQLEKIPRLTESPLLKIPSILQQFFHPPPPQKNWGGGGGRTMVSPDIYLTLFAVKVSPNCS